MENIFLKIIDPYRISRIYQFYFKQEFITNNLINSKFRLLSKTIIIDCLKKLNNIKIIS